MLLSCTPSCLPDAKRSGWVRARPAAAGPKKVSNLSRVISQRERESTEQAAFPGAGARFLRPAFVSVGGSFTWAITELDKQPNQPNAPSAGPAPHASHARCPSYPRHVFLPACLPFAVWSQSQLGSMPGRDPPQETRFRNGSAWKMWLAESRVCVQDRREQCVCGGLVEQYRLYFLSLSKDCVLKSEDRVPRRR